MRLILSFLFVVVSQCAYTDSVNMSIGNSVGPAGQDGVDGTVGPIGPIGLTGSQGPPGIDGVSGLNGSQGEKGDTGDQGIQGIPGVSPVHSFKEQFTMRMYWYADLRWISFADDNYGQNTENASETALTGVDPIYEWENKGYFLHSGETLNTIDIIMRPSNNTQVTDVEVLIAEVKPTNSAQRTTPGLSNDNQLTTTVLKRFLFMASTEGGVGPITTAINRQYRRLITLDHTMTQDGSIRIFMKPIGTLTATRYGYPTFIFRGNLN